MKYEFPKDFLWGAATASHQVEGNTENDWTEWERRNADRLAGEAKQKFGLLPNWKEIENEATDPNNYRSGIACDHYNKYEEDFDLAKSLGHNAHRFSIEWARIEPEEGKFNEKEIEHYRQVLIALRERGIEPFVTLWHWTLPLWLRDKGGILAKDFPDYFARYTEKIVTALKDDVIFWTTLNEPTSVIANSYFKPVWPPQEKSLLKVLRAYKKMASAHNKAYKVIHHIIPKSMVGMCHILKYQEPARDSFIDKFITKCAHFFTNEYLFLLTRKTYDWIGLQYYFHEKLRFNPKKKETLFVEIANDNKVVSDLGWEIYPEGIYYLLRWLKKYNKPIYITENGLADAKDEKRGQFIIESLKNVRRAISEGVDVRGYFYWSLLDNFEWDKGFWPRFGLIEIDFKTLERKPRPSAYAYKKIIEENAIIE